MSPRLARLRPIAPLAACLALAVVLLWPALTPKLADRLTIGGAGEDFLRQVFPWRAFVAATWAGGKLPLWNPHQYAGTPALADPQLAVLYPWRLLQIPFAIGGRTLPLWTVTVEAVAHLALGAFFTGALARRLGASRSAAALAVATFGAGGYLTGYPIVQLAVLDTAVWLPATLAALVAATSAKSGAVRRRWAALAAAATAMAVLAGHAQTAGFVVAAGCLWLVAVTMGVVRRSTAVGAEGRTPRLRDIAQVAAIWLAVAVALSAVQWGPTLAFVRHASRTLSEGEVLAGLPARDIVQLFAPHVVSQWSPLYVGIVPLVLALWGALRARTGRIWLAFAGGAWLFALGGNGPLFPKLLKVVPAFATFRHQERAAVLVAVGLAMAAALSLDAAVARRREVGRVFACRVGDGDGRCPDRPAALRAGRLGRRAHVHRPRRRRRRHRLPRPAPLRRARRHVRPRRDHGLRPRQHEPRPRARPRRRGGAGRDGRPARGGAAAACARGAGEQRGAAGRRAERGQRARAVRRDGGQPAALQGRRGPRDDGAGDRVVEDIGRAVRRYRAAGGGGRVVETVGRR
ncbi:MAG: hypothetical protein IPG72_09965 [Ardenticatenales bacterium]|nr:hypothetical protein [Ardenticatenales bacterium]